MSGEQLLAYAESAYWAGVFIAGLAALLGGVALVRAIW